MSLRLGMAGLAALCVILSGCAQGPAYPLMTPLSVAQSFGYDEKPLGGNRYDVVYVAPMSTSPGFHYAQSPAEIAQKDLAFDLAAYRAAQLAQSNNCRGFDILERHASTDEQTYGPEYWDDGWGWGGWHHRGWGGGWGWRGAYPPYWDYPPEHTVQVEVKLTVALINDVKPGQYDANTVINQVRAHYPNVDGPVGPGAPPVTPPPGPAVPMPQDHMQMNPVQPSGGVVQPMRTGAPPSA